MSPAAAMTASARFHAVCNGQAVDRQPMVEWATWWNQTLERWAGEGLPVIADARPYDYHRHFGLDIWRQDWIAPHAGLPAPAHHGAAIITDMDSYLALRPSLYVAVRAGGGPWPGWKAGLAAGDVGWFTMLGFFWWPRVLLGIEGHLYALADNHELIHAINTDLAAWMLRTVDDLLPHAKPDFMTFAEDLSYNHGPMLSQRSFDALLLPYYRQVVPALRERGIRVLVDSDGDVTRCLPWFEKAGIEGILPLERQAGVDIDKLQAAHPRTLFVGHFDKMTMPHGEAAMRTEFERLLPAMRRGRFIPSVDHQTPPGVSLAQYRSYLQLLAEYARRAAA
jgi:hypothetical protein